MKILITAVLLVCSLTASALAGKPPKHAKHAPPPAIAGQQTPSARLSQFTAAHLDTILAPIDQRPALPRTELGQLRTALADESAKVPDAQKVPFTAAIAVCDALDTAMNEREQALAGLQGSASVHSPSDLGAYRKEHPSWKDLRRERREAKNRKREATQTDNFFATQLKTNWTQRALQIRQQIQMLSDRQGQAERQAEQAGTAAVTPAPPPTSTPH